jgi:hypothetical protein
VPRNRNRSSHQPKVAHDLDEPAQQVVAVLSSHMGLRRGEIAFRVNSHFGRPLDDLTLSSALIVLEERGQVTCRLVKSTKGRRVALRRYYTLSPLLVEPSKVVPQVPSLRRRAVFALAAIGGIAGPVSLLL